MPSARGSPRWDLVLDGRRRFDLRVTVILDPALAIICWAHYAPPINDMFRKSYRKLLRWNDEFPFAKFSRRRGRAAAARRRAADRRRRRRRARPGARADPRHRRPAASTSPSGWLWIGGRVPDQAGRRGRERGVPRALRGPAAGALRGMSRAGRRPVGAPSCRSLIAVVAATGLAGGARRRPREVRAATPDLTIVGRRALRRPARPAAGPGHGRPDADEPPQGHQDHAVLLRPGVPRGPARRLGLPAHVGRRGHAERSRVSKRTDGLHAPAARPRRSGCTAARPPRYTLRFDLVDPGGKATRDVRIGDVARLVPGLGVRHRLDPGQLGHGRLPGRLRGRGRGRRRSRRRRPTPTGRTIFRTGTLADAADLLRLPRRRPAGRLHRRRPISRPSAGTPGRADDPVLAGRHGVAQARRRPGRPRPCRSLGDAIGLAWPRDRGRSSSRRRSAARPAATPACSTRRRGSSRSPTTRATSSSSTRPPTPGSTARCSRTAGRTRPSPRTTRLEAATTLKVKATGDELTDGARGGADPAQRLGRRRPRADARPRTTPTPRRSRSRGRSPSEPGRTALRAVWADAAGTGRGVPAAGAAASAASVGTATPELVDGPPDWRGLLDLLEARTGASYDDLWRTWVARDTDLPLLDARAAARSRYDAVVAAGRRLAPAAAGPRRDAGVAVRRRDDPPRRGEPRRSPSGPRSSATRRRPG